MLKDLPDEDLLQAEYIVHQRKNRGEYINEWSYELFLPHVCGQPTIYTELRGYHSQHQAAVGGAAHLKVLMREVEERNRPQNQIRAK